MRNKLCSRLIADKAQSLLRCKGKKAKPALLAMLFVVASSALYGLPPLIVTSLTDRGVHDSNIMFYKGGTCGGRACGCFADDSPTQITPFAYPS